jgi:hypothetical protein
VAVLPDETTAFEGQLDDAIKAAVTHGARHLGDVIAAVPGAFPSAVAERLDRLGLLSRLPRQTDEKLHPQPEPELHPLDYEWYFTPEADSRLTEELRLWPDPIACLGTPTVAMALAEQGREVTLLDRNPLIAQRMHLPSNLEFRIVDLLDPVVIHGKFGAAVFDAPWYPDEAAWWLWQAANVVRPGGGIAFSLLPRWVRPSAEREREQILEAAAAAGTARVKGGLLAYSTPRFEAEALHFHGTQVLAQWRVSDLVLISEVSGRGKAPPKVPRHEEQWQTWVVGQQVVKLRAGRLTSDFVLSPVPGVDDWTYTTVSRRDVGRRFIDLWTSRNRVARVGDAGVVATWIEAAGNLLAEGVSDVGAELIRRGAPSELLPVLDIARNG